MKKGELKNCPFCGGEAMLQQFSSGEFSVYCLNDKCNCEIDTNTPYKENAIIAWNTRQE